jgi:hypothetical protein
MAAFYASGEMSFDDMSRRIGEVVTESGHQIEITEEMINGAVAYADALTTVRNTLRMNGKQAPVVEKFEAKVSAARVNPHLHGTADHVIYKKGDLLYVDDYKFGRGVVVDPRENPQLMLYALGVMETEAGYAFNEVVLRIIQPRTGDGEHCTREWRTTPSAIRAWTDMVSKKAAMALDPGVQAAVNPGAWCRWCPALALCPSMKQKAEETAQADFSVAPKTGVLPNVHLMTVEQLSAAMAWQETIEAWFAAVRELILGKLSSGEPVPGWRIVEGRANRKWVDEVAVIKELGAVLGDRLYERKLLSPAKLERLIGKTTPIEHLTMRPPGKKTIAPDTDPRLSVPSNAQEEFTVWPQASAGGEAEKNLLSYI